MSEDPNRPNDPNDPSAPQWPNAPHRSPPPLPPESWQLNYPSSMGPSLYQPKTPVPLQFVLGVVAWALALVSFYSIASLLGKTHASPFSTNTVWISFAIAAAGIIVLCVLLHGKYRWTGFIPGVLIGVLLSCLIPVGLFLVLCGRSLTH